MRSCCAPSSSVAKPLLCVLFQLCTFQLLCRTEENEPNLGILAMQAFNGGKMNHVFVPGRGKYEEGYSCPEAKRCFLDPNTRISLKVDGECAMVVRQAGRWVFFRRQDNYKGSDETIEVPAGAQPASFDKHNYCFVKVSPDLVTGKGKRKSQVGPDTYQAIEQAVASGLLPDPTSEGCPEFVTVEWVGRKHQTNIDGWEFDHGLYVHGSSTLEVERTRAAVEAMAKVEAIEGLVLEDPITGQRFKLRLDMLPDSLFAARKKRGEKSTIKPKVAGPEGVC